MAKLLIKEYTKHITATLDLEGLAKTIEDGFQTDVKTGDFVITTEPYNAGVFAIDPCYKQVHRRETTKVDGVKRTRHWVEDGELIENPYTEKVIVRTSGNGNTMSVKAENGRDEKRIKVRKLNLLGWDARTNSYPRMSAPIIFRQKLLSFAEQYRHELGYFRQEREWMTQDQKDARIQRFELLTRLAAIPPFLCYYDEKYGFLLRRELNVRQIVMVSAPRHLSLYGEAQEVRKEIEKEVKVFKDHIEKRGDIKEEVVAEAMKPSRVEVVLEKHGMDGLDATYG
jgi:hypothetical protein